MSVNVYKGISFDGVHSFEDMGLYMAEYPVIEMPEVQEKWVEVPGRNGRLNLTRSLDGLTHYNDRECSFKFVYFGDKDEAMAVYSKLGNMLHGQLVNRIIFDEDPGYYWTGQLEVDSPDYMNHRSKITVKGDLEPYKYDMYAVGEDWLWDDLDFESGYIRDANDWTFTAAGTYTVDVGEMPVCPAMSVNTAGFTLSYTSPAGIAITQELTTSTTVVPGFVLKGSSTFTLTGSGEVAMTFRGGSL